MTSRVPVLAALVALALTASSVTPRAQVAAPVAPAVAPAADPATAALEVPLPVDADVRTGRLPNGLRYFLRQNGRPAKRVSMRLAVDVGSIYEDEDQRGLAHFLEHMAFNGSTHFKPGELVAFLESIGARFGPHVNASTNFDETIYMLDVPTDREGYVDKGLLALRDFAGGATLSADEIDKERGVVIEEWRGRLGAQSRITDQQLPVIFAGSRYADRLPIGLPDVLRTFPHQRLRDFYEQWYRADRMAVVVSGDLPLDESERLVKARFGDMPRPGPAPAAIDATVPAHAAPLYKMVSDPEAQGWNVTAIFKHAPESEDTVGDYRRSLVRSLGLQMLGSRLAELARKPDAPFLSAGAGTSSIGRHLSMFELSADVAEGGIAAGLEAVVGEARRVQQFGFAAAELDRAKRSLLAGYERAYNNRSTAESPALANELVRHFLQGEPAPGIAYEFALARRFVPAVTLEEVTTLMKGLIGDDSRVVLGVAPAKPGVTLPTDDTLKTALTAAFAATVAPWSDGLTGRELVPTRPAPGKVTGRRQIPEVGVTVLTLSNGMEVWLKPTDFKADQVVFSAYAFGGGSTASEAEFKDAALAPALVSMGGVGDLNPVDLEKVLAGRIASASPEIDSHTHGLSGSATPKDLETALQLVYLTFTAPGLTDEAFELLKRRFGAMLQNQQQSPRYVFGEKVRDLTTSGHYSAKGLTAQDVAGLDVTAMRRAYTSRFANAADFTFFMVGAFTEAEVTPLVEKWLAPLPATGPRTTAFKDMGMTFPAGVQKAEVRKGQEPASQTVMAFFADTGLNETEMHRARAAATLVGIRLRDILREQLGGTYGVSVSYRDSAPQKGYGAMNVSFGSAPDRVEGLQKAVIDEVTRLRAEGPSAEDLQKVQELERRDLETSARQNQYWLGSLQTVHMLGWAPATISRRGQRTDALTVPLLHDTIKKYFPLDRYAVVTLKPEA
ncbi:MAG TPA: insulinase family protein [Vicinamibacterales bacterium]|nr:insulinase family protein [Vicinamibacterales bacterium]